MEDPRQLLPNPLVFEPVHLTNIIARLRRGDAPARVGPDNFPIYDDDPLHECHQKVSSILALGDYTVPLFVINNEQRRVLQDRLTNQSAATNILLSKFDSNTILQALLQRIQWAFLRYCAWNMGVQELQGSSGHIGTLGHLFERWAGLRTRMSADQWSTYFQAFDWPYEIAFTTDWMRAGWIRLMLVETLSLSTFLVRLEESFAIVPPAARTQIQILQELLARHPGEIAKRALASKLQILLHGANVFGIEPGEAWATRAIQDLKTMPKEQVQDWMELLQFCATSTASKPSGKWLKRAKEIVGQLPADTFTKTVLQWFDLVAEPKPLISPPISLHAPEPSFLISETNATILRGLVWCFAGSTDPQVAFAISTLAQVCFKKVPGLGPRCPRVGNACLYTLSVTSSEHAAAQLSRLDSVVKQPTAKKRIGQSLDAIANLTGQTRADLEEKSVPTFDLDAEAKRQIQFANHFAEIRVIEGRDVEVSWFSKEGKPLKAVPADVKRDQAQELRQLRKLAKEIQSIVSAQRIRIERLLAREREWELAVWKQRYLDHALIGPLSRRLIWHFKLGEKTALGIWFDGKIVDVNSQPLDWLARETRVRLWHPIGFAVETVAAWRRWLENNQVCQPFKQAHREIYVLTDAELQTETYSNRFAAHIIRQHQFAALAKERGWKYELMGGFDRHSTPTLDLPDRNMLAEFWVMQTDGQDLSDSGISLYLSTDQVRFVRGTNGLSLNDVPAVTFSEVMRDVDLFVGVCSMGNDPTWQDAGEAAGQYWHDFSFGNLTESAKTRREVLERLLPKLKIAKQCSLLEKFLVVKGTIRTYKIHLGSGNILMEPNDQYLCIVPKADVSGSEKVFLPFEGDRTLAIILSKAFLLAEDSKIKDQSIVNQIRGK